MVCDGFGNTAVIARVVNVLVDFRGALLIHFATDEGGAEDAFLLVRHLRIDPGGFFVDLHEASAEQERFECVMYPFRIGTGSGCRVQELRLERLVRCLHEIDGLFVFLPDVVVFVNFEAIPEDRRSRPKGPLASREASWSFAALVVFLASCGVRKRSGVFLSLSAP